MPISLSAYLHTEAGMVFTRETEGTEFKRLLIPPRILIFHFLALMLALQLALPSALQWLKKNVYLFFKLKAERKGLSPL